MDFSLSAKAQNDKNSQIPPHSKKSPKKFSHQKTALKKTPQKFIHKKIFSPKTTPTCNKNYDFSFTFLLNFANFYSSSGENSLKFRKFLSNFRKSAKFSHAQSPILPPLEKNLQKICKKFQTLSFV